MAAVGLAWIPETVEENRRNKAAKLESKIIESKNKKLEE